jgi:hypothetical protein
MLRGLPGVGFVVEMRETFSDVAPFLSNSVIESNPKLKTLVEGTEEGCALVIAVLGSTELVGGMCRTTANNRYPHTIYTIGSVIINTISDGTCTDCNNTGWYNRYAPSASAAIAAVPCGGKLST